MLTFFHPEVFYLLFGIPCWIIALVLFIRWKTTKMKLLADTGLHELMMPRFSKSKIITKHLLFILTYTLLVITLARPRLGLRTVEVKTEGVDIIIALDISKSMLAEDLQPNRLERAKQSISVLLEKLQGDRIGLIAFAGVSRKQIPLTIDYATAKMSLQVISPDDIQTQGTSLSEAIQMSMEAFPKERKSSGAIIVLSDGEDHEGEVLELARSARQENIFIHTIGIGSAQGVPIPVYENGTMTGFKKDKDGNTVVTKLNETMLQQLAAEGGGMYVKGNNPTAALEQIKKQIDTMDKQVVAMKRNESGEDRFQWILIFAIIFLVIEILLSEKKSGLMKKMDMY